MHLLYHSDLLHLSALFLILDIQSLYSWQKKKEEKDTQHITFKKTPDQVATSKVAGEKNGIVPGSTARQSLASEHFILALGEKRRSSDSAVGRHPSVSVRLIL